MIGLAMAMLGGLPFYARSKYFPSGYQRVKRWVPVWIGLVFLLLSVSVYVSEMGIAVGLLTGLMALCLGYALLVFVFQLPRNYFMLFWIILLFFFVLDLLL